jgi:hypothetical protein
LRGRDAAASVIIPATGQRLELDDKFLLQGETRMSQQLRAILSSEGTMLVSVDGRVEEIPLQGAARAAQLLLRSCPA